MKFRRRLSNGDRVLVVFYSTLLAVVGVYGAGIPFLPIQVGSIIPLACSAIGIRRLFESYRT